MMAAVPEPRRCPRDRVAWAVRRAMMSGQDDEPAYIERSCVGGRQVLVRRPDRDGSDSSGWNGFWRRSGSPICWDRVRALITHTDMTRWPGASAAPPNPLVLEDE